MTEPNVLDKQNDEIIVWQILAGKITELKIQGDIFAVRQDTTVDPVKAAKDFINAFDVKRTAMMRKVKCEPVLPSRIVKTINKKTITDEHGEQVGRINNIPIYKKYIEGMYRKYPESFSGRDIIAYLQSVYKGSASATIANKQRAYIKFMQENGFIEQIEGKGSVSRKYKFICTPYDAVPIAVAEYDPKFMQDMKEKQLIAIRDQ